MEHAYEDGTNVAQALSSRQMGNVRLSVKLLGTVVTILYRQCGHCRKVRIFLPISSSIPPPRARSSRQKSANASEAGRGEALVG
jgi:hypothetical protein